MSAYRVTFDCDCDQEYGPCEQHGTVLAARLGSAARTVDELVICFLNDCLDIDPDCLSTGGRLLLADAQRALDKARNPRSGVARLDDEEMVRDLDELVRQVEAHFADLWVTWDDGYTIARVESGPLHESD